MFSLLVFNTDIIFKIGKWFTKIENIFSNFFRKSGKQEIEMKNLIKDKETY